MATHRLSLAAGATLALAAGSAFAQDSSQPADSAALVRQVQQLEARLAQQQTEIAQLRQGESDTWLDDRRREEVKALVRDVLADADTRATLLQESATAGYDKGFFLASADNNYRLRIGLESQIRYIFNTVDDEGADDDEEFGFQIRRARVDFRGHAISPNFLYRLRLASDRGTGATELELATVGYKVTDELTITGGRFKPQFLREENVSGFRQLALERSYISDYFTVDYTEGVEAAYETGPLHLAFAVHDGSYGRNTEFNNDRVDAGFSGRAEFVAAGDYKQFEDFSSWADEELAVLLGAGVDYELGEGSDAEDFPDLLKYTLDASAELGGFTLFAAFYGQSFTGDADGAGLPANLDEADQYGFVVQGGAFAIPDKLELFARYEFVDFDGVFYRNSGGGTAGGTGDIAEDELSLVTVGGNYYFRKHSAKAGVDLVYALDPVPASNTGSGLLSSDEDNQIAIRTQFQFQF